ncbi:hypothetical protein ACFU96_44230 [Streptomyces sp. NPDC057620]|uniref:hypothetical protein n=1 Tax=Streptomyces sp. NPDC057620 TaxID=3346185 RepID=UPI0036C69DFC
MNSHELAAVLSTSTSPLVREALSRLSLVSLEALTVEALTATEERLRQAVVDRVIALAAQSGKDGAAPVAAYFTATERESAQGCTWSPFIAALTSTEEAPDLRHTRTTAVAVPAGSARAPQRLADPALTFLLTRLAAVDPPGHEDVLRVHLLTRQVTRMTP